MLRTEADVVRTLAEGTYTLEELYARCRTHADIARANGYAPPDEAHPTDSKWKHRVRCALQTLRASGDAERVGPARWAIRGTREEPERMVLVVGGATIAEFELHLARAVDLLTRSPEPIDLIIADPPWGLDRGTEASERPYARNHDLVVPGYRDVPREDYEAFTLEWVAAAAGALRPGGQLAIITGPEQAAIAEHAARRAGLTWVTGIVAFREFALKMSRRPAPSHFRVTVLCNGPLQSSQRIFNAPDDLRKSRAGLEYPLDWWPENGRAHRPGLLRYDNALPPRLVRRIIHCFSTRGSLVMDLFLGSAETARWCWRLDRRFIGGDINPHALRFSGARLLDEEIWPSERAPELFPVASAA